MDLKNALKNITGGKKRGKSKKWGGNPLDNLKKQEGGEGDKMGHHDNVEASPSTPLPNSQLHQNGGADEGTKPLSTVGSVGGKRKSRKGRKARKSRKGRKSRRSRSCK
jgi:hypothetical protein